MHRTEGVDYTTEEGKRRYIDPNLPSVRGTILNAESMNALQEEICNVIEKAGLTLNATAAADRTDGWDQLWAAITSRGIIGLDAFDSTFTGILNVLRYGINAYGSINPTEVGPCYTRIAIIPKLASTTRLISGRITHLGGDFPWNSCGMDFMLEQRDTTIVAYRQKLRVCTPPGAADGTLYYKDVNDTVEIWAFCTASYPRIIGTMIPNGNQYWNPNASAEWTATDPTGLTQFTEIAEDAIPDSSVMLSSLNSEVTTHFATAQTVNRLASDVNQYVTYLSDSADLYKGPSANTEIALQSDTRVADIDDENFVENGLLTLYLGDTTDNKLVGDWNVTLSPPTASDYVLYVRIKGAVAVAVSANGHDLVTVNVIINDYYVSGNPQITIPVVMPYNSGILQYSPTLKFVKQGSYWTQA